MRKRTKDNKKKKMSELRKEQRDRGPNIKKQEIRENEPWLV
jgi:hypothetical protein